MGKNYLLLRESKASTTYGCAECSAFIPRATRYFRDEPHPAARMYRGETVRHLCVLCVQGLEDRAVPMEKRMRPQPKAPHPLQLALPFKEAEVRRTLVQLVTVRQLLEPDALSDEELMQLLRKMHPQQFEELVLDRVMAMGMEAKQVGHAYNGDGGVDILFWPSTPVPVPFLGAIQVKHTRSATKKMGPDVVRDFAGALSNKPFQVGMVVTNTSFTPNAQWFADQQQSLIRLRGMHHLKYWIRDRFLDAAEWREMPREIELSPGRRVRLDYPHLPPEEIDLIHSGRTH